MKGSNFSLLKTNKASLCCAERAERQAFEKYVRNVFSIIFEKNLLGKDLKEKKNELLNKQVCGIVLFRGVSNYFANYHNV